MDTLVPGWVREGQARACMPQLLGTQGQAQGVVDVAQGQIPDSGRNKAVSQLSRNTLPGFQLSPLGSPKHPPSDQKLVFQDWIFLIKKDLDLYV